MSGERVRVQVAEHVATVTLTRAEKHNALDPAMFQALAAAAEQCARTPGVRVVLLHGDGPSFCSGLDLASLMSQAEGLDGVQAELGTAGPNRFQRAALDWVTLPVPVIAALHGAVYGGGLQIALGADVRLCAPDARLSIMESRWGLVPDMGITRTLPRLVRADVARELTYTARVVNGEEAAALGLVTRVDEDPLAAATALAREIAARSPDAVRAAKRLYAEAWSGPAPATLALEAELQRALIGSPNQIAAVSAGMTRQPAEFVDP